MIFKNSNKSPEMAEICNIIQNKYVPTHQAKVLEKIIFDGDQLRKELKMQVGQMSLLIARLNVFKGLSHHLQTGI